MFSKISTKYKNTCGLESKNKFNGEHLVHALGKAYILRFKSAWKETHYDDVIMTTIAAQITSLPSVYSTVYSGPDQSKHQSSASLAFVWGIHRGPVNSPHKWPVTRKMFPFDDVIMLGEIIGAGRVSFIGGCRQPRATSDSNYVTVACFLSRVHISIMSFVLYCIMFMMLIERVKTTYMEKWYNGTWQK